ncbi:ARM repeat-containing protein [Pholiota conissans]|uniref:MMS19 nucleotide excision repair protein n=1 Tax=Pholiota conissans TaxID=109636 RepID=A0A9P6CVB4_9AGAR|nr:ARM repeat-containing protein [Pholiota conissans]
MADISEDRANLTNVVKALGEYLTSEESDMLQKGVQFLAMIVARSPQEKLNSQSARVLTSFFAGKLDDSVTIKPALEGLASLASLPLLTSAEVNNIAQALFAHVKMKAITQDVRFKVFSIIDSLMAFHRDVLRSMGSQFIVGYINLAEGEKDPRNLMVAFAIARVILIDFDVSDHVEGMFNILFCYFPITFRPPPNDKYGITTIDLRMALRGAMAATPTFGPMAIPVFLEKISAGSRVTKKDTLQTMASCLPVYGSALARVSARKLWNALKLEIFQPVDSETEEEALKAFQVLVKTIYTDEEAAVESNEDVQGFARDACEECIQILKEPEKSLARPATKILCAFMSTTPSVARYTISQAVPHLVSLFHNPDEISSRPATLVLLAELTNAARDSMLYQASHTSGAEPPLTPYKDDVLGILSVGLTSTNTRNMALAGLKAMASTRNLLSDEELAFIVHNVNQIIEGNVDEFDDSSNDVLEVLSTISEYAPRHVADQTLPLLFSSLPDQAPSRHSASERAKIWRTLSALQTVCTQQELFESLVIRLTTKLDLLCFPLSEQAKIISEDPEPTAAYAHMILKTLADTLSIKVKQRHADVPKYIDRLVSNIFNLFMTSAFMSNEQAMVATDSRLIQVAAEIVTLVVQSLPIQRQQSYSNGVCKAITVGNVADIAHGFQKTVSTRHLSLFEVSSTSNERNLMALLAAAIVAFYKEISLSLGNIGEFLDMLLKWVLDVADNDLQRYSALHIMASILNRHVDELSSFLIDKLDVFWDKEISNQTLPNERRIRAISAWIWVTKALLVRKHPLAMTFSERLYNTFGDETVGWEAARAIGDIASPDPVFTKVNHAEIKVLFVQKYVGVVLPQLINFAKDNEDPIKQTASLVALTSLIKVIPRGAYVHQMPQLIPLLLRGLDLPDADIRSNVIDTFLAAAEGDTSEKSLVSEHTVTLVNSMLRNSKVGEMTSTKVRISALRYLAVLPSIVRYDVLHPYKLTVLRELAMVLDDPKRAVRKEAVDARTNW